MEKQWHWSIVALVIIGVVLQGSGGRVDADVLQPRLAAQSPEFLRYASSAQSGGGATGLGLVPSPVDRSYLDGEHVELLGSDAPLPARYDLRTGGRVTGVRNQGTSSACWAFAAYGSLESTMLPAETLDFSENNLKNASGFDYGPNNWGNGDMATAYLTRWSGPIAEAVDPYDPSSTTSSSGLRPMRHVQNVMILPKRPGPLDTADIKRALIDYGALCGSMSWAGNGWADTTYYKLNTGAYYYAGSADSNHVVAVVGWDDAFSASNFSTPPPGNGAWIVKNSWGKTWGKSGYFFISYYDSVLFKKSSAYCFQAAEPTTNYTHVYQYDPLGHTWSYGYGTAPAWEANVFVAAATENVRAIGFYTLDVDCSYEAKVYGSWDGSTFSNLLSSTTGTIPSPGYHTIVLPSSGAPVAKGQTFGVVVKMETTNYRYPIALEQPIAGYSMGATANMGQSYMGSDGVSWIDVAGKYANTNVCVKAYTGAPSATATLKCQASPAEAGSVAASPPSANNAYSVGTVVTLTAAPAAGWRFVSWTGATQNATDPLKATVTMDADKAVAATFQPLVNPPPAAALFSPANGSTVAPGAVTFTWPPVSAATMYEFVLYDQSGNITADSTVTPTSVTYDLGLIGTVMWKVRAGIDNGNWTEWSPVWNLIIQPLAAVPGIVQLSSPANGATVSTSTVTLSWNSASGVTSYNVALDTSSSFTNPVAWSVAGSSQTTSVLSQNTTYYWRVASVNASGFSPWSSVFSFTTRKPQVIVTLTLQLGSTRMPVSESDGTDDTVILDAAPVLGAGDRTLVPVRAVAEAMGGTVGWDPVRRTATVTVGSNTLELTLGKNTALFNGTTTQIDSDPKVLPLIINGRTMLPLRFVVESLGAQISYDPATKTITITYTKS